MATVELNQMDYTPVDSTLETEQTIPSNVYNLEVLEAEVKPETEVEVKPSKVMKHRTHDGSFSGNGGYWDVNEGPRKRRLNTTLQPAFISKSDRQKKIPKKRPPIKILRQKTLTENVEAVQVPIIVKGKTSTDSTFNKEMKHYTNTPYPKNNQKYLHLRKFLFT